MNRFLNKNLIPSHYNEISYLQNVLFIHHVMFIIGKEIESNANRNIGNAKADRIAANMLLPWILVTWIIIIFNIVAGVIFGLELEFPMKVFQ